MRLLDRKWTELSAGYQAVRSLQARLDSEFSRAVEVGYQQQYKRDLTEWQKKRRVFVAFAVIAPLSIITLCISAYYFREVACVIVYWVFVVLVILVTLAVAARNYIGQVMNRPRLRAAGPDEMDLEKRWWAELAPRELKAGRAKGKLDLAGWLAGLPESFLARRGPPVEGEESLYVFAPGGPWIFTLRDWSGEIVRESDHWQQLQKGDEPVLFDQAPDDQWLRLKEELAGVLNERFPETGGKIQGGVVFTHPKVKPLKDRIQGNTAAYGLPPAWISRLNSAAAAGGLTPEMQLHSIDALIAREQPPGEPLDLSNSAKELAQRLYQETTAGLRGFVAKMVG